MKLTDDMLYQYASEARDIWLAELPQREEVPQHTFSRRFHRKMKRLLKQQRRTPRMRKVIRYARIAIIFIFVLMAAAFSNSTIAEASWGAVVEIFTKISDGVISFRYSSNASFEESSFPESYFTYFPEGMEEVPETRVEDITFRHRCFQNTAGEEIDIFEELIYSNSMTFTGYDQNNPTLEFFYIGSEQAAAVIEDGKTKVSWIQKNVLYTLVTNLPMETTKKIAKGLKQKPIPASSDKKQPSKKSSEEEPRWGGDPDKGFVLSDYTEYGLLSDEQREEKIQEFGLRFSEEEIAAGTAIAKQYYKDLSERQRDPALFYPEELEELKKIDGWLKQGVEIEYDEQRALRNILSSSNSLEEIEQNGAGTVMILLVTVPASPPQSAWHNRMIFLHRDNIQSDWVVRTEGI